jgi:hypothetical protein
MKTVLLLSDDHVLSARIADALDGGERLVVGDFGALRPISFAPGDYCLVVADVRGGQTPAISEAIQRLRVSTHRELRCAFIMNFDALKIPKLIGSIAGLATDVVLADVEPVGILVRAYLNDPVGGLGGAVALTILLEQMPATAWPMLDALLGSGFEASSVKQCASYMRRERSALTRALGPSNSNMSPKFVVDLAKASYAVVHISMSHCSSSVARKAIRFASSRSLRSLLKRVFAITPEQIRESPTDAAVLLRRLLRAYA